MLARLAAAAPVAAGGARGLVGQRASRCGGSGASSADLGFLGRSLLLLPRVQMRAQADVWSLGRPPSPRVVREARSLVRSAGFGAHLPLRDELVARLAGDFLPLDALLRFARLKPVQQAAEVHRGRGCCQPFSRSALWSSGPKRCLTTRVLYETLEGSQHNDLHTCVQATRVLCPPRSMRQCPSRIEKPSPNLCSARCS